MSCCQGICKTSLYSLLMIGVTIGRDRLYAIIVFTSQLLTKVEYNKVIRQPHTKTLCVVWYHMHPCVVVNHVVVVFALVLQAVH